MLFQSLLYFDCKRKQHIANTKNRNMVNFNTSFEKKLLAATIGSAALVAAKTSETNEENAIKNSPYVPRRLYQENYVEGFDSIARTNVELSLHVDEMSRAEGSPMVLKNDKESIPSENNLRGHVLKASPSSANHDTGILPDKGSLEASRHRRRLPPNAPSVEPSISTSPSSVPTQCEQASIVVEINFDYHACDTLYEENHFSITNEEGIVLASGNPGQNHLNLCDYDEYVATVSLDGLCVGNEYTIAISDENGDGIDFNGHGDIIVRQAGITGPLVNFTFNDGLETTGTFTPVTPVTPP